MKKTQVGVYYFPNYHVDKRNEAVHGKGWTEWQLMKHATPRFPGHGELPQPLWGYNDEADPEVMEMKIDAAADHGVDFFIYDWYYYDDGLYLERGLEEGYMGAKNNSRVKFCLMWANHDWKEIHPRPLTGPHRLLYPGTVTTETFDRMTDYVIEKYFLYPSYQLVNGAPYFSFYDLGKLMASFGSLEATRRALDAFRSKTKKAGFPDAHLNAVVWGRPILPGETTPVDPVKLVKDLGFDSVTSYVWVHHAALEKSPMTPYEDARDQYFEYARKAFGMFGVPYYPNVSMGWDSTPRTVQSEIWSPVGYPYTNIISGNTPAAFGKALKMTRELVERNGGADIVTINAWNEWTEGSYLEPDTKNKMGYLEAIRDVFASKKEVAGKV